MQWIRYIRYFPALVSILYELYTALKPDEEGKVRITPEEQTRLIKRGWEILLSATGGVENLTKLAGRGAANIEKRAARAK